MKSKSMVLFVLSILLFTTLFSASAVSGQQVDSDSATMRGNNRQIEWQLNVPYERAMLSVVGPNGYLYQHEFSAGETPYFKTITADGSTLAAGSYAYEIQLTPLLSREAKADLAGAADDESRQAIVAALIASGMLPDPAQLSLSGYLTVQNGHFLLDSVSEEPEPLPQLVPSSAENLIVPNDQVILDDLIVDGSICAGMDCANGESFGFDTIRLKENNLRIRAVDTSSSASFPTNDWQITFNDSSNGGANKFSIDDIDGGRTPFTIIAGAPNNSLFVSNNGRLGLGTATPVADVHMKSGNTPTVRLEQDGSNGFTAQTWDVAGNEANFFIRDASNGSTLPFRIFPAAPSNSLTIEGSTGDVGLGTTSPTAPLHIVNSNGSSKILIEETNGTVMNRVLLEMESNGAPIIQFTNNDSNVQWRAGMYEVAGESNFAITRLGSAGLEFMIAPDGQVTMGPGGATVFTLTPSGDLTISGTLSDASSRELKENFIQTDASILDQIMALPIYFYNYKTDEASLQHIGPTAEDFAAIFEVGADNKHISPRDLAGVAVAAVQELTKQVGQKDLAIEEMRAELKNQDALMADLEAKNAELEARLVILEAVVLSQIEESGSGD